MKSVAAPYSSGLPQSATSPVKQTRSMGPSFRIAEVPLPGIPRTRRRRNDSASRGPRSCRSEMCRILNFHSPMRPPQRQAQSNLLLHGSAALPSRSRQAVPPCMPAEHGLQSWKTSLNSLGALDERHAHEPETAATIKTAALALHFIQHVGRLKDFWEYARVFNTEEVWPEAPALLWLPGRGSGLAASTR